MLVSCRFFFGGSIHIFRFPGLTSPFTEDLECLECNEELLPKEEKPPRQGGERGLIVMPKVHGIALFCFFLCIALFGLFGLFVCLIV